MSTLTSPNYHNYFCLLVLSTTFLVSPGKSETVQVDFFNDWAPFTPIVEDHWQLELIDGEPVVSLIENSEQRPPVRRPQDFMLIEKQIWSDYEITLDAKSNEPETKIGRDVVVIFGYQDFLHFYYAHISNDSNGTAHNVIMKVMGDTRETINTPELPEPKLTNGWHTIKARHSSDGTIEIFVDDMFNPVMTANDTDYPTGTVGFGSFDDFASFDNIQLEGQRIANGIPELALNFTPPSTIHIEFTGDPSASYELEESTDMISWQSLGTPFTNENDTLQADLTTQPAESHYYRITTQLPLLPDEDEFP